MGSRGKKLRERERMRRRPDTNRVKCKPHVLHPNFGCKSDWLFNDKAVGFAFSLVYLTEHIDLRFLLFNE